MRERHHEADARAHEHDARDRRPQPPALVRGLSLRLVVADGGGCGATSGFVGAVAGGVAVAGG